MGIWRVGTPDGAFPVWISDHKNSYWFGMLKDPPTNRISASRQVLSSGILNQEDIFLTWNSDRKSAIWCPRSSNTHNLSFWPSFWNWRLVTSNRCRFKSSHLRSGVFLARVFKKRNSRVTFILVTTAHTPSHLNFSVHVIFEKPLRCVYSWTNKQSKIFLNVHWQI
jgi:hypothetical protein